MLNKDANLSLLKGIGEKTEKLFKRLGVETIGELLEYYPRGYDKYAPPVSLKEARQGEVAAIRATVKKTAVQKRVRSLQILNIQVTDENNILSITFFNMPYLKNTLLPGSTFIFRGLLQNKNGTFLMEQPKIYKEAEYEQLCLKLQPVYSLTKGLSNQAISKAVRQILENMVVDYEYLPAYIIEKYQLLPYKDAVFEIHFPTSEENVLEARKRLAFEELFFFILKIQQMKVLNGNAIMTTPFINVSDTKYLLEKLSYRLTNAQLRTWKEISKDLQDTKQMNRLIQGDVGSGKTIIAVLALLMTAANGYQSAFMAPTEVLARQHFESILELSEAYGLCLKPKLLTGSMTAKQKREAYAEIADGSVNVIIGTHALIQDKVEYKNLMLVITDEQHRFGVKQRETLANKGKNVNILVMSATPIPRTLAVILYGDLDISVIDELPANRLPIKNCVVTKSYRNKAYEFMQKEILKGRQVYIICPMVEEGEMEELENVVDYTEKLKNIFPQSVRVDYLHGKMKPLDKAKIMDAFSEHNIDILVSTTVIEVGINVPNAVIILIENSERFGLSQLHQLRGRVGRGKYQSYCIFMCSGDNKDTMKRLDVLNHSNDGFHIANEDLKQRGPGDFFGIRQSGLMDFKIADIYADATLLTQISKEVSALQADDLFLLANSAINSYTITI